VLELERGGHDHLLLRAHLPHWEELIHFAGRARRIANLDLDLDEPTRQLAADRMIRPTVRARPGLRPPGTWDPFETGVRAIIGQQVSIAAANTLAGRLVRRYGTPVPGLSQLGLTHTFPTAETLASADLAGVGLTNARGSAVRAFACAVIDGRIRLDRSVSLDRFIASVVQLDGIGPWTAQYLALRLGEPDAYPAADLGLRQAVQRLSSGSRVDDAELSDAWRPWRAVAAIHLWTDAAARRRLRGMGAA
jgi:AraC family transcriptional regulator, regulatory protein of adaptative response / DNA-3-methyladenine glycosylase II